MASQPSQTDAPDHATPDQMPDQVTWLVEAISCGQARLGATRLVCVDGPAGSGKTTLADALATALRARGCQVATLAMDDLYDGWTGLDDSLEERLLAQVIRPLSSGERAHWQRYDWAAGAFGAWETLDPPSVLVLEGCGSGARAYAAFITILVWVEASRAVRIARGIERDGAQVLDHWLAWMDLEARHFAANNTRDRADIRLSTD